MEHRGRRAVDGADHVMGQARQLVDQARPAAQVAPLPEAASTDVARMAAVLSEAGKQSAATATTARGATDESTTATALAMSTKPTEQAAATADSAGASARSPRPPHFPHG